MRIGYRQVNENVAAEPAINAVGTPSPNNGIGTVATVYCVVARATIDRVTAIVTGNLVIAGPPVERICAGSAGDLVVACTTVDSLRLMFVWAPDLVGPRSSKDSRPNGDNGRTRGQVVV